MVYLNTFLNVRHSTRNLSDEKFEEIVGELATQLESYDYRSNYSDEELKKDWEIWFDHPAAAHTNFKDFNIKVLVQKHSEESCRLMKGKTYQEEIEYIISNKQRNKFIKNLAVSLGNNTLVLYQMVEKHGEILYNMIKNTENLGDRKVFFVHGGTDTSDREEIRQIMEKENDAIVVASYGTFSTGINIRNLHNIIFASPSKSRIKNLQSIGRGLRKSEGKDKATLYDIADDMRHKKHMNFTLKHFIERTKIYTDEKFPFKIYKIGLKK